MARTVPTAAMQMGSPPAGTRVDLAARITNLEDLLRSYAAGDIVPGMPVVLKLDIPDGATANVDTAALPFGIEIDDVMCTAAGANGANANTMQLQTGAAAVISDAMSLNGKVAGDIVRGVNIAAGTRQINAGSVLRVRRVKVAGDCSCRVRVDCTLTGL